MALDPAVLRLQSNQNNRLCFLSVSLWATPGQFHFLAQFRSMFLTDYMLRHKCCLFIQAFDLNQSVPLRTPIDRFSSTLFVLWCRNSFQSPVASCPFWKFTSTLIYSVNAAEYIPSERPLDFPMIPAFSIDSHYFKSTRRIQVYLKCGLKSLTSECRFRQMSQFCPDENFLRVVHIYSARIIESEYSFS